MILNSFIFSLVSLFLLLAKAESVPMAHISGPNCWNQALVDAGLLSVHRYTSPKEFKRLLNQYCVPTSIPTKGSLGRITLRGEEYHAFTWISEEYVYAKNSFGAYEVPRMMNFEEMYQTYPLPVACRDPRVNNQDCEMRLSYYNCQPELVEKQSALILSIENRLSEILYSPETLRRPEFRHCYSQSRELRVKMIKNIYDDLLTQQFKDWVQHESRDDWIDSFLYQVNEIEMVSFNQSCPMDNEEEKRNVFHQLFNFFETLVDPR